LEKIVVDKQTIEHIELIEKKLGQIESTKNALEQAIKDYLKWMEFHGYSQTTLQTHKKRLARFFEFIKNKRFTWDEVFTFDTLKSFQSIKNTTKVHAVRELSRYLFEQNRIRRPIEKQTEPLPKIYEQYLVYHQKSQQAGDRKITHIKRVLAAFHDYLQKSKINLSFLKIEHIDSFMAEFNASFAPQTCRVYRFYLRGFLSYLYHERRIIKRDLAPLVRGRRIYAQAKPPKFLRPQEVQRLFASLSFSSPKDIRNYAMVHLAYFLGLRPQEISLITLNDISFSKGELTVKDRKSSNPIILPIPEETIKAIAAYIVGARPKSKHRRLFLNLVAPYWPISVGMVGLYITKCMRKAGLSATAYWLRHTYAQNLLESGRSIFEVKEMMGHDKIESTKNYLHINTKLMREVLFD
jgi:integrase/recombinase XerD